MDKKIILISLSIVFEAAAWNGNGQDDWNPPSLGPITTWTAPVCGNNDLVLQPFFYFINKAGNLDNNRCFTGLSAEEHLYQVQQALFIQYGVIEKLEIDFWFQAQETWAKKAGVKAQAVGVNDSYVWVRYQFLDEKYWVPCVTGFIQLKFPTGKYENADSTRLRTDIAGTGSFDHGYGINLTKRIRPFMVHADVIPGFPMETEVDCKKTQYGMYLNYDLGAEYLFLHGLNFMAEMNGFWQAAAKIEGNETAGMKSAYLSICAGLGWSCDKVQTLLVYQRTIVGQNTAVINGLVFSLVYNLSLGK